MLTSETCSKCNQTIQYEVISGYRVYRVRDNTDVYQSRCGCGNVERTHDGKIFSAKLSNRATCTCGTGRGCLLH